MSNPSRFQNNPALLRAVRENFQPTGFLALVAEARAQLEKTDLPDLLRRCDEMDRQILLLQSGTLAHSRAAKAADELRAAASVISGGIEPLGAGIFGSDRGLKLVLADLRNLAKNLRATGEKTGVALSATLAKINSEDKLDAVLAVVFAELDAFETEHVAPAISQIESWLSSDSPETTQRSAAAYSWILAGCGWRDLLKF